jgi:hypothetical protein
MIVKISLRSKLTHIKKGGVGELTQNINTLKIYFSHILFDV